MLVADQLVAVHARNGIAEELTSELSYWIFWCTLSYTTSQMILVVHRRIGKLLICLRSQFWESDKCYLVTVECAFDVLVVECRRSPISPWFIEKISDHQLHCVFNMNSSNHQSAHVCPFRSHLGIVTVVISPMHRVDGQSQLREFNQGSGNGWPFWTHPWHPCSLPQCWIVRGIRAWHELPH